MGYLFTTMRVPDHKMRFYLNRLRWEVSAGLSVFDGVGPQAALGCAKMRLEAIEKVLNDIDRDDEAIPIH